MSAGRVVDKDHPSAAEAIIRAAENYAPDANRMLVLIRLARLVENDDCLVYPSVEWIAHHTRLGESTVERIVAEFRAHGIMEIVGTTGQGGSNIHRISHERIAAAYSPPEPWEKRWARSKARHKAGREKFIKARQAENVPPQVGSVNDAVTQNVPPHRGSVNGNTTGTDVSTLPHGNGNAPPSSGQRSPTDALTLPHESANAPPRTPQRSPAVGDKGFRVFEGLKQGTGSRGMEGRSSPRTLVAPASPDATDARPANGTGTRRKKRTSLERKPWSERLADACRGRGEHRRAEALADAYCEEHTLPAKPDGRDNMARDLAELARLGFTANLMREAITMADARADNGSAAHWPDVKRMTYLLVDEVPFDAADEPAPFDDIPFPDLPRGYQ
ncbi:hypothetical protein [Paraburkholderia sp. BR10882]|uniref:hypothetical protein n=1 Tax=unclassified Paraburkholderia TaxID=2615204 RepID=UPI0034D01030